MGSPHPWHAKRKDPRGNHFPDYPLFPGPDPGTGKDARTPVKEKRSQTGPSGLSDVRRQLVGDKQTVPAAKPNKADV